MTQERGPLSRREANGQYAFRCQRCGRWRDRALLLHTGELVCTACATPEEARPMGVRGAAGMEV